MHLRKATELFLEGYFSTCERSSKTISAYKTDLEQFQRTQATRRKLASITPEAVEAWAQSLKVDGFAPASIRRKMAVLKVFFNYWVRKRVLERSPLWLLRLEVGTARTLTRTLTEKEMGGLLRQARKSAGNLPNKPIRFLNPKFFAIRDWAIVELLFATGIRVGEATSLRLDDFILEQRMVVIRGKGRRERLALLTEQKSFTAVNHYYCQRQEIEAESTHFLLNRRCRALSTHGVATVLKTLSSKSGIQRHITPHMLRHTSATLLLKNGADLRVVQEFLGHASITTTQRYTHVTRSHLQETLERHHPRLGF